MLSKEKFEQELIFGSIFYFTCPELGTNIPHYFICVCKYPEDTIILSCCTSQYKTVKRFIEIRKLPESTLVYVPCNDPENCFTKDTYINCNEYFEYYVDEFYNMYTNGLIEIEKRLPLHSYEQILLGFNASPLIEKALKKCLPAIDDY